MCWLSAALRDRDPEAVVLQVVRDAEIEWVVSEDILQEYRAVMSRPRLKLPADVVALWIERVRQATRRVDVQNPVDFPRDPKDGPFIACALAAQADFLISGDRDLLETDAFGSTLVITVADFKLHLPALDRFRGEKP